MPSSPRWSSGSVPFRFEWRPSRWLLAVVCLLAVLAAVSVIVSDLPAAAAWPLAFLALVHGAWLARREWRRPPREVVIQGDITRIDGVRVEEFQLHWRGALAFARWRDVDGKVQRLVWWPDRMGSAERRELRLAAAVETLPRGAASMAP